MDTLDSALARHHAGGPHELFLLAAAEDEAVVELYRHLAACDLAVVQGGLTTAMELTASRPPFLYFPLRYHFDQNLHVRHRLERYRAGRCMDCDSPTPADIAAAIASEIGRDADYRTVATDGAARATAMLAILV